MTVPDLTAVHDAELDALFDADGDLAWNAAAELTRRQTAADDQLRALVQGEGLADGAVAERLGVSRDVARRRRIALGLSSPGRPGRPRSAAGVRTRMVQTHLSESEYAELMAMVGDGEIGPRVRAVLLEAARRAR